MVPNIRLSNQERIIMHAKYAIGPKLILIKIKVNILRANNPLLFTGCRKFS